MVILPLLMTIIDRRTTRCRRRTRRRRLGPSRRPTPTCRRRRCPGPLQIPTFPAPAPAGRVWRAAKRRAPDASGRSRSSTSPLGQLGARASAPTAVTKSVVFAAISGRRFRTATAPSSRGANTTRAAAHDYETDDGPRRNRLFPEVPRCERFDLPCSILVFSCSLVFFLFVVACALCYAMHNKRQQREKLVPCDAYCTCPAHANA